MTALAAGRPAMTRGRGVASGRPGGMFLPALVVGAGAGSAR
jgi:hypothetical protein